MRSITRFALLSIASTLAVSAIVPASAATRHRAPAPSVVSEPYLNQAPVAARAPVHPDRPGLARPERMLQR